MAESVEKPMITNLDLFSTQLTTPEQSPFSALLLPCWPSFDGSPLPAFTPDPTPAPRKVYIPSTEADAPPLPVNALQCSRILKRREARSKLRPFQRNNGKTYMHESRHLHAVTRMRGPKGKFVSKEEMGGRVGRFSAACQAAEDARSNYK